MDIFPLCENFLFFIYFLEPMVRLSLSVIMLTPPSVFMKLSLSCQMLDTTIFWF